MAATVEIRSMHGVAAATETTINGQTVKFKRADNDANDAANPIPKPGAGEVYSWRKSWKIKATVTPDGDIFNLRFFSDGAAWATGVVLYGHKIGSYTQGGSSDETNKIVQGGGSAVVDVATLVAGAPLTVNAGTVISNPDTGFGSQDFAELQLGVANTASRGKKGPRTLTYRFEES